MHSGVLAACSMDFPHLCYLFNMTIKLQRRKIWRNSHANMLEGCYMCYGLSMPARVTWYSSNQQACGLCVVLGASKRGKGPSLKACSSFSGSSFCILVSWLWSANPKSSVWEAVGTAQALEPAGAEGLSTYVHVSISGEDLTSCVYLVSATESWEQGTNMSDNVFHIEIIKENCCWREMCL